MSEKFLDKAQFESILNVLDKRIKAKADQGGEGEKDHSKLSNLNYAAAGHTGFEPAISAGTIYQRWRGDKTWQTKHPIDVRDYASFSAAIDAIGATEATLLISEEKAVSADKTVPSNVTLRFLQGGSLNIANTKIVTINGYIEAGLYRIFKWTGTGQVVFGSDIVREVYPEWWGENTVPGTTDMLSAILMAIASIQSGIIRFGSQVYGKTGLISLKSKIQLLGNGRTATKLKNLVADTNIIEIPDSTVDASVSQMTLEGHPGDDVGTNYGILLGDGINHNILSDLYINSVAYGVKAGNSLWRSSWQRIRVSGGKESFRIYSPASAGISNIFEDLYSDAATVSAFHLSRSDNSIIENITVGNFAGTSDAILISGFGNNMIGGNFEAITIAATKAVIHVTGNERGFLISSIQFHGITGPDTGYAYLIKASGGAQVGVSGCRESAVSGNLYSLYANGSRIYAFNNFWLSPTNIASGVYIDSSGNVVIGGGTPTELLHISKSGSYAANFLIENSNAATAQAAQIYLKQKNRWWVLGVDQESMAGKFFLFDNTAAKYRVVVDTSGNIIIGGTAPQSGYELTVNNDIYAVGDVSALTFTDRTKFYKGNAIDEILKIKAKNGDELDHNSLPEFAKSYQEDEETKEKIFTGRNLGAMVSMLTVAIKELDLRLKKLETK